MVRKSIYELEKQALRAREDFLLELKKTTLPEDFLRYIEKYKTAGGQRGDLFWKWVFKLLHQEIRGLHYHRCRTT